MLVRDDLGACFNALISSLVLLYVHYMIEKVGQ